MGRVISAALQFIDGFTKPSKEVIQSMRRMGNEAIKAGKQIQNAGKTIANTGAALTKTVTIPIAGVSAVAVKTAADFEKSMSQVAATMGKTKDEIKDLTGLAKHMGATTAFSASEAAEGINILAMAGLNAKQIGDSLGPTLDLAAAGAMDMGSAASYITGSIKGFKDEMKNATKYADIMAKGASLANTNVAELGEAISYGAATAKGYSQNVDSVALSLLRMAEQNMTGQTAATSLSRAMADLYSPTAAAKKALDSLKISAYNADGSTRDFNAVVDDLSTALKGMSEQQANALKSTIFTTNGMNAFNKMTASTNERVKELREGLSGAGGSAAQQAKTQLDNLNGQITLLKSAAEGIAITIGDKLIPHIKTAVSWAQKAADQINSLNDAQINNIIKWAGIAAAIGPALLFFGKTVAVVGKACQVFGIITKVIANFGGIAGVIASPAGVVVGVLAAIAAAAFLIIKNGETVKGVLQGVGGWFKQAFTNAGFTVEDFKAKFASIRDTVGSIAGKIGGFCLSIAGILKNEFAGSASEGMAEVNGILETFAGGAVKAFYLATTGADRLLKTFGALLDFFSGVFAGNWDSAAQGFRESLKNIFPPNMAAGLIKVFDFLLPLVKADVSGIKAVFTGLIQDTKNVFAGLVTVLKGIGAIAKGVFSGDMGAVLAGLNVMTGGIFDTIGAVIKGRLNIIKNYILGALGSFLPESAMGKVTHVFDVMADAWDMGIAAAKSYAGKFTVWISQKINAVKGAFKGLDTGKGIFSGLGAAIKGAMEKSGASLEKFRANISNTKARVGSIANNMKTIFGAVFGVISRVTRTAAVVIARIFGVKVSSTCSTVKAVVLALKAVVSAAFTATANSVKLAMAIIVPTVKVAFSVAKGVVTAAVNTIVSVVSGILTVFDGITTFIAGVFTGNWRQAWEGVRTIFKGIFDSLAALCKAPINAVIGIINGAISGINQIGLTIPDWVPSVGGQSFSVNIPTIPMLYKGTDNWAGGMAVIHDRGGEIVDLPRGSRVYPHDKSVEMAKKEGAQSGAGITIHIQKLADKLEVRSDADIDRIAEALAYKLRKIAFNTGTA